MTKAWNTPTASDLASETGGRAEKVAFLAGLHSSIFSAFRIRRRLETQGFASKVAHFAGGGYPTDCPGFGVPASDSASGAPC